jgi:protein-tyrosine phosphatase
LSETEPDKGAVLWHCTDGKDRTGCAAMLLLSALVASRETIMEDYLLTNEYNAAVWIAVRQKAEACHMPPVKRDAMLFMSGCVEESYMEYAIDLLEKRYGDVTGYLKDALGIGSGELHALREKYLCDTT